MKGQGEAAVSTEKAEAKKSILKTVVTAPDQNTEKKVKFADEITALSTEENKAIKDFSNEENKAIKDFSKAFDLDEDRMGKIFKDIKTPGGIKDIDKAYLTNKGEKNPKFKESSFFKGLFPENDIKKEADSQVQGAEGAQGAPDDNDPLRRRVASGGQGKEGEKRKGDNKNLMRNFGLLFIACLILATGGAALPLIGGFLASLQGLFIAGAVGAGAGAGLLIKDQFGQGNNKVGVEMGEGPGAESNQGAQGQAQAQEKSPAPAPAPAQEKSPAPAPAPEKAQASAQAQGQEKAPASIPDLMELMKKDLEIQIAKEKVRAMAQKLENNPNLSKSVNNAKSLSPIDLSSDDLKKLSALQDEIKDKLSKVGEVKQEGVINKLANVSKNNWMDSKDKNQNRTTEALNLEDKKLDLKIANLEPASNNWATRMRTQSRMGSNEIG